MSTLESNQFEAPAPVPRGVSPGAKKFHLYRLIVRLYEQVASLRVTAHAHTPNGPIEGKQFEALPPIPPAAEVVTQDEYLYRQIVFVYEQIASLRATTHGHTAAEVPHDGDQPLVMGAVKAASDIEGKQFEAPTPLPRGVSGSSKDEHLYRQIASLYEQVASLRAMAHLHTKIGVEHPR